MDSAKRRGMTLDLKKARQLCTDREFALVAAARRPAMSTLTPKRLQANALRSRTLRDKFRVMAKQQKAAASPARPRSLEKAALFDEVLTRYESRLAKLEGVRTVGAPRSKSTRGTTAKRLAPAQVLSTDNQHATRKRNKLERSSFPRAKSHTLARNRRQQARRDTR
jgi:hypothetical protein